MRLIADDPLGRAVHNHAVADRETARDSGVTGTPETFFVSADGEVVAHVNGTISDDQMTAGVAAARSGRPAGVRSGGARRPTR